MKMRRRSLPTTLGLLFLGLAALRVGHADVRAFPSSFRESDAVVADGATLHLRVGGQGPAVLLLHGFGDTGDMWEPLARTLVTDHTVIVPDLRGMGLSSHPPTGYRKADQARDLLKILDGLKVTSFQLVTHDIGNMVGFAMAEIRPDRVTSWVVMDAPLPGLAHWDDQYKNPKTWHFNFRGPDVERLVAGRERILLDRFYNDLSANPSGIDEQTREHYAALYAKPQAIHDAFEQFAAFALDATDNQAWVARGPLAFPVLAVGGEASYGLHLADEIRVAASSVQAAAIPNAGHWLMEEQPDATVKLILAFLKDPRRPSTAAAHIEQLLRMTPAEIAVTAQDNAAPGTSGIHGMTTTVLTGDPAQAGPYIIRLWVPAHTTIQAHSHRDDRSAVVVSGTWQFGYGANARGGALKTLPAGSVYTEPAGQPHFARTGNASAEIVITGYGPSDTTYVDPRDAPRP